MQQEIRARKEKEKEAMRVEEKGIKGEGAMSR